MRELLSYTGKDVKVLDEHDVRNYVLHLMKSGLRIAWFAVEKVEAMMMNRLYNMSDRSEPHVNAFEAATKTGAVCFMNFAPLHHLEAREEVSQIKKDGQLYLGGRLPVF